jgi:hypothetical protein
MQISKVDSIDSKIIKCFSKLKPAQSTVVMLLIVIFGSSLQCQNRIESDINSTELWGDMTLSKSLNENWSVGGDFGLRTGLNDSEFWLFYVRPNISYYAYANLKFTFGLASFNSFSENLFNTYEFRIYQDAVVQWPKLGLFNFTHRLRLEERFFSFDEASIGNDFRLRGRYLLGVRTDRFSLGGASKWSVFGSIEPFFRLNGEDQFVANNFRWDTALSYQATEKLRIELHYILQSSEFFTNNKQKVVENIFRVRVYQQL